MINQTFNYQPTDKVCFQVPRETDLAYQNKRRNDWQFRIYAQMLKRKSQDYSSYFFTLTYSDDNMPYFTLRIPTEYNFVRKDFEYKELRAMCFSREDIRKFVRGIQQDLLRYYNITDFDYIICSEYGSNTQRSHYHGSFNVPNHYKLEGSDTIQTFTSVELHCLIRKHWSKIISRVRDGKKWRYTRQLLGWVLPSRACPSKATGKKPLKIDPENLTNAAIYVSKYCTKDLTFYGRKDVLTIKKTLQSCKGDYYKEKEREFRHCLPFLKCSQHFGECITEMVLGDDMPNWCCDVCTGGDDITKAVEGIKTPLHTKSLTSIPDYIKRKLFEVRVPVNSYSFRPNVYKEHDMSIFDYDEDKLELVGKQAPKHFVYEYEVYKSDFYRKCLPSLYNKAVSTCQSRYEDFYVNYFDKKEFNDWLLERFENFADTNDDWQLEYNKLKNNIYELSHSCYALAIYNVVYRNRCNPLHLYDYYQDAERKPDDRKYTSRNFISKSTECINVGTFDYLSNSYRYDVRNIDVENFHTFNGETAPIILDEFTDVLFDTFPDSPEIPCFYGNESIDVMCSNAYDFYRCSGDVVRYPNGGKSAPYEQTSLRFNTFVCFTGFDSVLLCIEDYLSKVSNDKLTLIANKEKRKKKDKDNFNLLPNGKI